MALWLYLHFPSLQLDAMYQQADAQTYPLIIVHDKQNEVVQLNQLAANEGIKVGMGLGTASSLCAELQVKPYDQMVENKVLKRIAHWLYSVTADIALYPPNGLLIGASSMLSLHHNLAEYWRVLSQHLECLGFSYQYATGYSPYAARILARQGLNRISADKNWLIEQIKKQPLASADLDKRVVSRLRKVGIHTFSELLSLSLPQLSKRFSLDVVNYIGQLTGHIRHHVTFYIPPEHFEQYLELYHEVSNSQYLEKPLLKLYKLLEHYLRLKDKTASELIVVLHQRDCDDLSLSIIAAQGEYKAEKWLQLSTLQLESVVLNAPVIGITLKAQRILNKYVQHTDLFQGEKGQQSPEELVAILTAKLGQNRVKGVQVVQDHRPEVANQLGEPLSTYTSQCMDKKLRPSLLFSSPVPLHEQITLMPYPERVITGWWDNHQVIRDYFIGRTESGRWLWLFKDHNQQWFVHGVFS
ncbi:Y-family DNA polymerase [Thalassotalea fusca]